MLIDVLEAKPLGGHRLRLRFDNAVEGEIDLKPLLDFQGVFEPLRDPHYFAQVRVNPELGTICWPNGADWDPVTLYCHMTGVPLPGGEDSQSNARAIKLVRERRSRAAPGLSKGSAAEQHEEFWQSLGEFLEQVDAPGSLRISSPPRVNYVCFGMDSDVRLFADRDTRAKRIGCGVECIGAGAKQVYERLEAARSVVHWRARPTLEWRPMEAHVSSQIRVDSTDFDPNDRASWPKQVGWLALRLGLLHNEFSPLLSKRPY